MPAAPFDVAPAAQTAVVYPRRAYFFARAAGAGEREAVGRQFIFPVQRASPGVERTTPAGMLPVAENVGSTSSG